MKRILPKSAVLVPEHAERVFKGQIYDVYQWQQEMFDGSFETFEMLKRPDTLDVIAVKDDKIVILEEEQPGLPPFYGLPGGRHDVAGETEVQAAQRELLEETGMIFREWCLLEVAQPQRKIERFMYIFLATGFESREEPQLDPGEKMSVTLREFDEVLALADNPKTRFLPKELLQKAGSLQGLLDLPEVV